ncbi:MAG: hypothetical protein Q8Q89_00575 [bacterium]|nr:hypothetical protein [bacterium]
MESKYKIFIAGIFMLLIFGGIKINNYFYYKNTPPVLQPSPPKPLVSPQPMPTTQSTALPLDNSALTPQTFSKIMQKIKNAPNSIIKSSIDTKMGHINFYYSVAPDPLDHGSKEALVFEMETTTNLDENGNKYPNGPISDLLQMRDTDLDTFPNDYWTDEFGEDLKFRPLTQDTPEIADYLSLWATGITYFKDHLLQ